MPHIILTVIAMRNKKNMNNNSTGIYLGMDVSEKSIELFALSVDKNMTEKGKLTNSPAKEKALLDGLR
jgi:hypothetical protein